MDRFVRKRPRASQPTTSAACETSRVRKKARKTDASTSSSSGDGKGAGHKETGFQYRKIRGDLFGCPEEESLAHCIDEEVRMGKGIAKIFREKFGGVKELTSQGVKTGGVAVLRRGKRFVYYLVTKEKYWKKPTYDSLARSLRAMADHCNQNKVTRVSMPRIGCGLDGLKWDKVEGLVKDVLGKTQLTVTIYTL